MIGGDDRRRPGDPDDLPPIGAEARAQRRATSAPLLWFLLGLILIVTFVVMIGRGSSLIHAKAAGPPPLHAPAASGS